MPDPLQVLRARLTPTLIVLGFLVASSSVAILAGDIPESSPPPGTPEHALHDFLSALDHGETLVAYDWLSRDVRGHFSFEEFNRDIREGGLSQRLDRVHVVDAVINDDAALMTLDVARAAGSNRYIYEYRVAFVYEDYGWKIDEYLTYL